MTTITLSIPWIVMDKVNQWAEASGLPPEKFQRTALILGARSMSSSLPAGFVESLSVKERTYASDAANNSVTPQALLQIVMGSKTSAGADELRPETVELVIDLPDEMVKKFTETADSIKMEQDKFFALSFAMGARVVASTLESGSVFPLDMLVQAAEGKVTPEMLMRAMTGRKKK